MTRLELLRVLVGQARANGFQFKKWYMARLGLPWINPEQALEVLSTERRYYALLFAHEFAENFWKAGEVMTFQVPTQTFPRVMADGSVRMVKRKAYTRRSAREDVWRYHLREMAVAEEPLRYIRRFVRVAEDEPEEEPVEGNARV